MRLGFIGTGKIASSVIIGICTSKISFQKILVSPRNRNIAQKLKKRFRKVNIAKTNQEIVDKCNWVFLAVTPKVGEKVSEDAVDIEDYYGGNGFHRVRFAEAVIAKQTEIPTEDDI